MRQLSKADRDEKEKREAEERHDLTKGFFENYYRRNRRFGLSTYRSPWNYNWSGELGDGRRDG